MRFDREKYIDLIMYILFKASYKPTFGKTVLCSILYFIDFNYYEQYGRLLTKETYMKSKKGIKPKHFSRITQELIDRNQLFLRKEPYYNRTIHRYRLAIIPQVKFDSDAAAIVDSSLEKLSHNNATSISKYARNDPPCHIARLG